MITMKAFIICMCVLAMSDLSQDTAWRGIMPLHSSRAEVIQLLGAPGKSGVSYDEYSLKDERAFIQYSDGTCEGATKDWGWNVLRDTVISISVYPKTKPKFADFKLDETKYRKEREYDYLDIVHYRNDKEGISIEANTHTGVINSFTYYPAARDDYLRCPAPPENPDNIGAYCSRKFDWYFDVPLDKEKAHLHEFAEQLKHEHNAKGYIISYAGRRAHTGEAQTRAERAKSYLISVHGIETERLVAVDGGYREDLVTELWVRPKGCRAPIAAPTIAPREVQIINEDNGKTNNRRSSRQRHKQHRPCQ